MQKRDEEGIRQLCRVLAEIGEAEEIRTLLDDLCTIQEMQALAQRMTVASLLHEGKNYGEIHQATGISSATISRVNRCLQYGSGGYLLAMKHLKGEDVNGN